MTGRGLQNRPLPYPLKSAFKRHEKWRHHRTQRNRPLVFYGDYESWQYALDSQDQPSTWLAKQAVKQGAKAAFRFLGAPAFIGSIATTIAFRPLEQYLKQQKNFTKKSIKYLKDFKSENSNYNSTMFYAFSPIVWITMNYGTSETHVYKAYRGDKRIEALI